MFKKEKRSLLKAKNLLVQDVNGTELDFPDLELGEDPAVGDKATVGGQKAEGAYTLPDGTTLSFVNGEITKVLEPSEELAQAMSAVKGHKPLYLKHKRNCFMALGKSASQQISVGDKLVLNGNMKATGTFNAPNGRRFKLRNGKLVNISTVHRSLFRGYNKVIKETLDGKEVVFPKLTDGASPDIGSEATIDGKTAEGKHDMPWGETYTFKGGILKSITKTSE